MTKIESWQLNQKVVADCLKEKKKLCDAANCPDKDKASMCEHFNKLYHDGRWEQLLKVSTDD